MKSSASLSGPRMMLLAMASGSSDVIAFLLLGHVFASAMTGNTALLGIALSDGNLIAATQPVSALLGFAAGVGFTTIICNLRLPIVRQELVVGNLLGFEVACLVLFAIVWELGPHSAGKPTHYVLILLCSVAMGIQGVVAKRMHAPGVNTIVFTSTLVTIISSSIEFLLRRFDDPAVRSAITLQISAFAAYGAGAVLAGLLYWADFVLIAWLPATVIVATLAIHKTD